MENLMMNNNLEDEYIGKLLDAARLERDKILIELRDSRLISEDVSRFSISAGCIEKYAVRLFLAGAEYQKKHKGAESHLSELIPEESQKSS